MAISPLNSVGPASVAGAASPPKVATERFGDVLRQSSTPGSNGVASAGGSPSATRSPIAHSNAVAVGSVGATAPTSQATRVLGELQTAQTRMDAVLQLAQSGKSFTPAELISLQTHVYRASQELDLAGKVVEKATGGVKQVLQTQV